LTYQIDITELVEEKVVDSSGDAREIILLKPSVTSRNSCCQAAHDPTVHQAQFHLKKMIKLRLLAQRSNSNFSLNKNKNLPTVLSYSYVKKKEKVQACN